MTTTLNRLAELVTDERFRRLGARELRCINVLLAHTDHDGDAWPSTRRIAELAGVDYKDAQKVLRSLRERGFLREIQAPTGRRSRRVRVIPGATDRSLSKLRSDAVAGGESPPAIAVEGGGSPGGESPPARSVEGGVLGVEGGDSTPIEGGRTPPRTPEEPQEPQGEAPPSRFRRDLERRRKSDGFDGVAWDLLGSSGCRPQAGALALDALRKFRRDGGSLSDLEGLIDEARGGGKNPAGLLLVWLRNPRKWRDVLADAGERSKHAGNLARSTAAVAAADRDADLGRVADGPRRLGALPRGPLPQRRAQA